MLEAFECFTSICEVCFV